jgi:hypothetical protein
MRCCIRVLNVLGVRKKSGTAGAGVVFLKALFKTARNQNMDRKSE